MEWKEFGIGMFILYALYFLGNIVFDFLKTASSKSEDDSVEEYSLDVFKEEEGVTNVRNIEVEADLSDYKKKD